MPQDPNKTCSFCGSYDLRPTFVMADSVGADVQIWQCKDCFCHLPESSFAQSNPPPESRQIAYHEDLWSSATADELEKLAEDLRQMVRHMTPLLGPARKDRHVVELGCGRGGLLRALLDCKYTATGCEPSRKMVAQARKYYRLDASQLSAQTANEYLDTLQELGIRPSAFIMWHVLEHVRDPLPILERCLSMLAEDGRLIFQLPMLTPAYIFPEHYFFFTLESIEVLSRKLGNLPYGFAIDTTNRFLSIWMGKTFVDVSAAQGGQMSAELALGKALAEPIRTRDQIIGQMSQQLAAKNAQASAATAYVQALSKRPILKRILGLASAAIPDK